MTGTYNTLERDGKTVAMGGYSNIFVVNENYAVTIPKLLPLDGVAPLLCAGITLYSPLKHWNAGKGTRVAVMGLGGLGHMGVKFAHALGAHVTVISHSPNKRDAALAMGADEFITVKGLKAIGNRLSTNKIKNINKLESLEPPAEAFEDEEGNGGEEDAQGTIEFEE